MSRCFESGGSSSSIRPQTWSKTFLETNPATSPPPMLTGMKSSFATRWCIPESCPGRRTGTAGALKRRCSQGHCGFESHPGHRNFPAATVSQGAGTQTLEASALQHSARLPALAGRSPLLRLQSDERLVALIRRGHHGAFEALVQRYQPRLLAFCRHMVGSQEDAEDVLQEVFAASFNAICADERPINARPWLYRIARNRCLNHLRRPQPAGQDSMDIFERDGGASTADTVHKREEFLQLVGDVQGLPETQRTALLLREIDALSYDQIAEAMDTTVPSVKSLLVRARVSLAEAAEARLLTCDEVRLELGQVAEGIAKTTAPVRRHLKGCERCRVFRTELRRANRALAAVYPVGPLVVIKKFMTAKIGIGAGTAGGGAGAAAATSAGAGAGSALSAGMSTIVSK